MPTPAAPSAPSANAHRDRPGEALRHCLDEVDRDEAEHQARPGERHEQRHVEPHRHVLDEAKELELGDEVRRVRQEYQPQDERKGEKREARPTPMAVVHEQREQQRHPSEHEVPEQVPVVRAAAQSEAEEDEADGETGHRHEDAERGTAASTGAREIETHVLTLASPAPHPPARGAIRTAFAPSRGSLLTPERSVPGR